MQNSCPVSWEAQQYPAFIGFLYQGQSGPETLFNNYLQKKPASCWMPGMGEKHYFILA